jgi:hypothetical protein
MIRREVCRRPVSGARQKTDDQANDDGDDDGHVKPLYGEMTKLWSENRCQCTTRLAHRSDVRPATIR